MKKKTNKQEMSVHLRTIGEKPAVLVQTFPLDNKGQYIDIDIGDAIVSMFPLTWKVRGSAIHFYVNGKLSDPIFNIDNDDSDLEKAIALTDHLRSVLTEFASELKKELNWLTPVTHIVVTEVDIETNGWQDHLISIVKMILADITAAEVDDP